MTHSKLLPSLALVAAVSLFVGCANLDPQPDVEPGPRARTVDRSSNTTSDTPTATSDGEQAPARRNRLAAAPGAGTEAAPPPARRPTPYLGIARGPDTSAPPTEGETGDQTQTDTQTADAADTSQTQANNNGQQRTAPPPPPQETYFPGAPRYTINAMIGQVNGNALYASRVLEPLEDALVTLGQNVEPAAFRAQAEEMIRGRLLQLVLDSLILGEAERNLSAQERAGLEVHLRRYREQLLRQGLGSLRLTEELLMERHGKTLEQMIEDERQKAVVQAYLRETISPQIYVNRKMVERYYHDNLAKYQPQPKRTVRLIRVTDEANADTIEQQLRSGQSFTEVASSDLNRYKSSEGGMWGEVTGNEPFRIDELNTAIAKLREGQRSARIEAANAYWWVYVESLDSPPARSLQEAQLEIENTIRAEQFQQLTREYREELLRTGSYNNLEEMTRKLVEIAVNNYAPTTQARASDQGSPAG